MLQLVKAERSNSLQESTIHIVLRLRGGGVPPGELEMGVAAGGLIDQAIVEDEATHEWDETQTKWFNVQILNSGRFQEVTGLAPPPTPANAKLYAELGFPFFDLWEEKTTVAGDFSNIKSVGQLKGVQDNPLNPKNIVKLGSHPKDSVPQASGSMKKGISFMRTLFRRQSSQGSSDSASASQLAAAESKRAGVPLRGGKFSQGIPENVTRFFYAGDGTLPLFRTNRELRTALEQSRNTT